jgi:hypothetical protein
MIPIVASLLGSLAENGLGLLSSALQAKGKEVVEKTLGVKIPDNPTPEDVGKLRQLQFEHEERLIELGIEKAKMELAELDLLAKAAQSDADNITDRWKQICPVILGCPKTYDLYVLWQFCWLILFLQPCRLLGTTQTRGTLICWLAGVS